MRPLYFALCCCLALPALPITVVAQEFEAGIGPTIHERCHMMSCGYSTITDSKRLASLPDGELYKVYTLTWSAEYAERRDERDPYAFPPVRTNAKEPAVFEVFCSKVRPMIFFPDGGKWQSARLRPGDAAAVFGATESAYQDYWGACHHFFPRSADDALVGTMARRLGYRFSGGYPAGEDMETATQPADLMK